VLTLLGNVLVEVGREDLADRIFLCELPRLLAGGLHQRHAGADDAVEREQVLGIELSDPRIVDEPAARPDQLGEDELDLPPQALALARGNVRFH